MFNIGAGELVFILIAALLILGPQRLPEFARTIGKFVREFRRQTDDVRTVVEREFYKMDQEFQQEPQHKVHPPTPAALPSPVPVTPPSSLGSLPDPVPVAATTEPGPAPAHEQLAAGAPLATSEAPAPGAADPNALPRLEPIPGTVARNAPKSGQPS
jgi:sec-independent protein translocase protein TatB